MMVKVIINIFNVVTAIMISIFFAFLLFNIFQIANLASPFNMYLAVIPMLLLLLLSYTQKNHIFSNDEQEKYNNPKQNYLYYGLGISSLGYLLLLMFDIRFIDYKVQIIVCIFLALTILSKIAVLNYAKTDDSESQADGVVQSKKNLFSIYYINISKVFEIAMLLNNQIMTSIAKEKMKEHSDSSDEQLSIDINLKYLEEVAQGLSYNKGFQKMSSEKNRVLENFDVKTTKSNLLEVIIRKGKICESDSDLVQGDLVVFKDVQLTLVNQKETMDVMKMLLNGAFNGTIISGESNEMQIEMNMASLINSLLKDCVYELLCQIPSGDFVVTIPMTFENDFENSYNIYDLLIGKVTIIGIYKGVETGEPYKSVFELFSQTNGAVNQSALSGTEYGEENVDYSLTPSSKTEVNSSALPDSVFNAKTEHSTSNASFMPKRKHIDVIAIIQEINSYT